MNDLHTPTQKTNDRNPPVLPPMPLSFDYPNFESVDGLALVGAAAQKKTERDGVVLRLTPASGYEQGSAWYARRGDVASGFSTTFRFRLTEPAGLGPADGFTFNVQNLGPDLSVGELGTEQQLSVQFRTWAGDTNHIYVHNLGARVAGFNVSELFDMRDGSEYEVVISVSPKMKLSVTIGQVPDFRLPRAPQEVISNVPVRLSQFSPAFVGFGARTGAGMENHDILRWSFQSGSLNG